MGSPTRYQTGVATQLSIDVLGDYPLPDPLRTSRNKNLRVHTYVNDFDTLIGTDFTTTGTGTPTFALGSGVSGTAVLTTSTGTTDSCIVLKNGDSFGFVSGQKGWYVCAFKASDVLTADIKVGFIDTASNQNGLYFHVASGASGVVALVAEAAGVATTLVSNVTTLSNNVEVELGMYYNGTDLLVFVNNAVVARVAKLSVVSTQITPTFQLVNTTGVARTLTLDYVLAAEETPRLNAESATQAY